MNQPFHRVLGVLAKQPLPALVKTRLAAETSPQWAARVAAAFLSDSLDRLVGIEAHRILVYAPREAEVFFSPLARGRFALMPQVEGDLGQRMAAFFSEAVVPKLEFGNETNETNFRNEARGSAIKAVLVGVDSPTLPLSYIEEAFAKLERADIILGPATHRDYYLVGCAGRVPPIFENITWSRSTVLEETVTLLKDTQWRLGGVPPLYYLHTFYDLRIIHRRPAPPRHPRGRNDLPLHQGPPIET